MSSDLLNIKSYLDDLSQINMIKWSEDYNFYIVVAGFIISLLLSIHLEKKWEHIYKLVTNPFWLVSFILLVAWCVYIFKFAKPSPQTLKSQMATEKAIFAFIIAIMGYFDFTISVFWLVWIVAYFISASYI